MRFIALALLLTTGLAQAVPNAQITPIAKPVDVKQISQMLPETAPPKWLKYRAALNADS